MRMRMRIAARPNVAGRAGRDHLADSTTSIQPAINYASYALLN